jgi:hypothetical protein
MLSWFGGMGDWPSNNWWGANRNDPPEPFEYFLWDAEWSWETTRGHNNGWVAPGFRRNDSGGPTIAAIWHSLRANSDFMMLFADRAYKHLFNDGILTDRNCIDRYLTLNNFIRDAIVAESKCRLARRRGRDYRTGFHGRQRRQIRRFPAKRGLLPQHRSAHLQYPGWPRRL